MKSEFESREAFECIFGDEGEIDLSKDETGEYSFQSSLFAYSFFFLAWQYRQTDVDELQKRVDAAFRVLSQLNDLDDEAHKRWKREACMFSQGESNAYEHSVRLLEQALKGGEA